MRCRWIVPALAVLCTALGACAKPDRTAVTELSSRVAEEIESSAVIPAAEIVKRSDRVFLGSRSPHRTDATQLQLSPQLKAPIHIQVRGSATLQELARMMELQSSIIVSIDPAITESRISDIILTGTTVKSALDAITARLGYSWRSSGTAVRIFATDIRSWTIFAPAVSGTWSASVGVTDSSAAGGAQRLAARDQVSLSTPGIEFWEEIEQTVQGMLSPAGKFTLARHSGELVVVDRPPILDRIDIWVSEKNRELVSQVIIAIDLFEIDRSAVTSSGFSLEGVLRRAFGEDVYTIEAGSDDVDAFVGLNFAETTAASARASKFAAILRSAVKEGTVSTLTSTVVRGINGLPVPLFFGDERSYLQRREIVVGEGNQSVRLHPGTLQDGIALNILPKVFADTGRVQLMITLRTTRIKSLTRFPADAGPADPMIQLPDLESRSVLLPVLLSSGETLYVAGLDTARSSDEGSSGLLSRGRKTDTTSASLVLLITPRIIPPPPSLTSVNRF